MTFEQACDEHLRYLEDDKQRKPSYLDDCRSVIRAHLKPRIGADTPVVGITTADIDRVREQLLASGLAHRTVQKHMILLGGILARAKRKGWITESPAENAERVTVRHSDEFNVLSVEQVHAVARAAVRPSHTAMILVAAFTGLRLGELLALRWKHVDFAGRILHVRRNLPAGQAAEESRSRTACAACRCPIRRWSCSTSCRAATTTPARAISRSATAPAGTCRATTCATGSTRRSRPPGSTICAGRNGRARRTRTA